MPRFPLILGTFLVTLLVLIGVSQIRFLTGEWSTMQPNDDVYNLAYSPDREYIATSSLREGVRLWRASDKTLLDSLGDQGIGTQLNFAPEDDWLAWSYMDYAFLYDLRRGRMVGTPRKASSWIYSLAFTRDGQWFATGTSDRVELWHVYGLGDPSVVLTDTGAAGGLVFSPDSQLLAGMMDGKLQVWDVALRNEFDFRSPEEVQRGIERRFIFEPQQDIMALAFSPASDRIAISGAGGTILVVDTQSGKEITRFGGMMGSSLQRVAFSPDGSLIGHGTGSKLAIWRISDGTLVTSKSEGVRGDLIALTFSADGREISADYTNGETRTLRAP